VAHAAYKQYAQFRPPHRRRLVAFVAGNLTIILDFLSRSTAIYR